MEVSDLSQFVKNLEGLVLNGLKALEMRFLMLMDPKEQFACLLDDLSKMFEMISKKIKCNLHELNFLNDKSKDSKQFILKIETQERKSWETMAISAFWLSHDVMFDNSNHIEEIFKWMQLCFGSCRFIFKHTTEMNDYDRENRDMRVQNALAEVREKCDMWMKSNKSDQISRTIEMKYDECSSEWTTLAIFETKGVDACYMDPKHEYWYCQCCKSEPLVSTHAGEMEEKFACFVSQR